MKSKNDHFTAEIFGNRPGRPRKVNAMTVAQRVAKHRANKKADVISVTSNGNRQCGDIGMVGQLG
jgi:hypothetical protein